MGITKKNHYNPCFWTAFWNPEYLDASRSGETLDTKPREQVIYSLNLKSNKILRLKTENIFFDKGAGLATITRDNALDYCKRAFPNEYKGLKKYYDEHPGDLMHLLKVFIVVEEK